MLRHSRRGAAGASHHHADEPPRAVVHLVVVHRWRHVQVSRADRKSQSAQEASEDLQHTCMKNIFSALELEARYEQFKLWEQARSS